MFLPHWCKLLQSLSLQRAEVGKDDHDIESWSDSRAWWVTVVGFISISVRQGCSWHLRGLLTMPNRQTKESVLWSSSGAMAPSELKLWPRLLRWFEALGVCWHPPGVVPRFLWTESLGRMLGYVGWHVWLLLRSLGVQGSSQQPHDLPTFPRPSAQGLSPQGVCCILPRGVSSEPWCFCPLMQPGPKFQFTRGQGTRGTNTAQ